MSKVNTLPAGTRADMSAKVNIEKVFDDYFSRDEPIKSFVEQAIRPLEIRGLLSPNINYQDWGGGTGTLTRAVTDYLQNKNHQVDAAVVDANKDYLNRAKIRNLKVITTDLCSHKASNLDLITMRSVNQYNSFEKQKQLFENARNSLGKEGFLAVQVSTGTPLMCAVKTDIANLPCLHRANTAQEYYFTSEREFADLLQGAGFENVRRQGLATGGRWLASEMWARFNTSPDNYNYFKAVDRILYRACNGQPTAKNLHRIGILKTKDDYLMEYEYSIFLASKSPILI